jgi:hypothetical protein
VRRRLYTRQTAFTAHGLIPSFTADTVAHRVLSHAAAASAE